MEAVRLVTAELRVGAVLALVERLQADGALALVQGDRTIASLLLNDEPQTLSTSCLLHCTQLVQPRAHAVCVIALRQLRRHHRRLRGRSTLDVVALNLVDVLLLHGERRDHDPEDLVEDLPHRLPSLSRPRLRRRCRRLRTLTAGLRAISHVTRDAVEVPRR